MRNTLLPVEKFMLIRSFSQEEEVKAEKNLNQKDAFIICLEYIMRYAMHTTAVYLAELPR